MIELLQRHIEGEKSAEQKINKLREMLQIESLKILQDKGCFSKMAFVGGTALRVIYDMRRFSEDLDFSLINKKGYNFAEIVSMLEREFKLRALDIEFKTKTSNNVQNTMMKFPGILKALGLSGLKDEKISIKLEVDSNPPAGWQIDETLVNRVYVLNIIHLTLPSLYATKLHACFFRKYTKGRDFYDLVWYLGRRTKPNYELLNNAIEQTQGENPGLSEGNIKGFLLDRIKKIDFRSVKKDVERFLEDKSELGLLEESVIAKGIIDVFS